MKLFLIAFALLSLATPALAAEKCNAPQTVAVVDGMVCDFCAQGIIKTLKKNPAVKDVQIDLTAKTVTIDTNPGQSVSDEEINKLVDYSGYKLVKVEHLCKKG